MIIWILLGLLVSGFASADDLSVEIVDYPSSTLVHSPVYITALVVNNSNHGLRVPINPMSKKGWRLELSGPNTHLDSFTGDGLLDQMITLQATERYLFSFDVGESLTKNGLYEVRAVMENFSDCLIRNVKKETKLKRVQCWTGIISSPIVKILVNLPTSIEDIAALEYVKSRTFYKDLGLPLLLNQPTPAPTRIDWAYSYKNLKSRYPDSFYTFAAGIYAAKASIHGSATATLRELVENHPNNPLAQQATMLLALMNIENPHTRETVDIFHLDLPESLKEYISQKRNELRQINVVAPGKGIDGNQQ